MVFDDHISYLVSHNENWVTFFVQLEHEGYLSLGFGNKMDAGIVFLIEFQNGLPIMYDCQMIGNRKPRCTRPLNPIYNMDDFDKMENGGWRAIVRADFNTDFGIEINLNQNQFSAAYGHSPTMTYHAPGVGNALSFKAEFSDPIYEYPTNSTNSTDSANSANSTNSTNFTDPIDEIPNDPDSVNETSGNTTNSTDSKGDSDFPFPNQTDSTNTSQPIVRTINPSLYIPKKYKLNCLHKNLAILGLFLILIIEM